MNKKREKTEPPKASSPFFNLAQYERKPYFLPALGLCGLLMGILLFDANLSLTGDNAQFINLGRSLADGHGLSETIEGEPIPHTKYPFGFPLLLAITDIIFPGQPHRTQKPYRPPLRHLDPTHLSPHPPLCPFVHSTRRKRAMSRLTLSCWTIRTRSCPKSPFYYFLFIALLLLHRAQKSSTLSTLALAIIAMIAAYHIRSAGIILIGTGIIFFALHKKWKEAGLIAIGSFLLALPYQIRNTSLGGTPYIEQLLSINPYRPEEGACSHSPP